MQTGLLAQSVQVALHSTRRRPSYPVLRRANLLTHGRLLGTTRRPRVQLIRGLDARRAHGTAGRGALMCLPSMDDACSCMSVRLRGAAACSGRARNVCPDRVTAQRRASIDAFVARAGRSISDLRRLEQRLRTALGSPRRRRYRTLPRIVIRTPRIYAWAWRIADQRRGVPPLEDDGDYSRSRVVSTHAYTPHLNGSKSCSRALLAHARATAKTSARASRHPHALR